MAHVLADKGLQFGALVLEKQRCARDVLAVVRVVDLAVAHRLPAATTIRAHAEIGGLMSYGPNDSVFHTPASTSSYTFLSARPTGETPDFQVLARVRVRVSNTSRL